MLSRPSSSSKKDLPVVPEGQRPFLRKGLFSRSKSTQAHRPSIDSTPLHSSQASPSNNTQPITRSITNRDPRTLSQSLTTLDLSASYVPMERSRNAYTPQPNLPSEKSMVSGTQLNPSSLDAYPSPSHEGFAPPGQVIRLECSPRENGQIYHNDFQQSAAPYLIEASYQPPPPIHATYQPPPPQTNRNNAPRPLPIPGKGARALPALDAHPPSYPPPAPQPAPPTHTISRFLPSPPTSPPNSTSSSQSFYRSHSPASTELPDYSSGRVSYSPVPSRRRPLQIPINSTSSPSVDRPEYDQHSKTTFYQSPSTAQPPRGASPSVRVPDSPIHYTNISVSTDNGSNLGHSGRGNRSSVASSPRRNGFHLPASFLAPSGSSDSSGGKSSISSGVPNVSSTPFVFPGSRSVARPKALPKIKAPRKPWRWRDSIGKSPLSEAPHFVPPVVTAPSPPTLPNPSMSTIASAGSSNPKDGLPKFPDMTYYETSSVFSDESRQTSTTSSNNASRVYIYPVGRSRAQPKLVPRGSKGQLVRKLSGAVSGGETEGKRTGFMGMLLKKKTNAPKSVDGSMSTGSSVKSEPTKGAITPANGTKPESYRVMQTTTHEESREQAKRTKSRIGSYPLDPYDSVLLDKYVSCVIRTSTSSLTPSSFLCSDRHTGELLARLNPTSSPSFHNYGNTPPTSVLDLGCGQGYVSFHLTSIMMPSIFCRHWVVDAAIAWKGYGTKVTGYDMVDVSKALLPWVIEQGVTGNVQFVRGNL